MNIDETITEKFHNEELRDAVFTFIKRTYDRLSNHCFFAIKIRPFQENGEDGQWHLFSDIILFAEKHRDIKLRAPYFRHHNIAEVTAEHIHGIDLDKARFDIANEGFFFKDCFILLSDGQLAAKSLTTNAPVDLLLLFEKNERDEAPLPCPACRSWQVAGNSYPTLGVRSWECQNPICPERSAFDRGNRYSLSSIIKQEAIISEADQIPEASLRKWKLDVVSGVSSIDVAEMLVRHFTLHGDAAIFVNADPGLGSGLGRKIVRESFPRDGIDTGIGARFKEGAFFCRFLIDRAEAPAAQLRQVPHTVKGATVYQGDCFEILSAMESNCYDGAVTSPPYYNARSYATWPNIYCYLYDMYNSARKVYEALKPGGFYLFNVFDYFDNENTIVLSAMGKKRMILGAYIVSIFRHVGFEIAGNVVWYKGQIEGKRNFNQGNRSPYYQFPFNCWEHCFMFRKPGPSGKSRQFPTVLDAKPVIKIVRGKNILGHSAPFPPEIPRLLVSQLKPGEVIIDPYAGSMTTARVAHMHDVHSVSIELHQEYCELGLRLLQDADREAADLFGQRAIA